MNNNCEFSGEGYCMCEVCISMRKDLEELTNMKAEDIMEKESAKRLYEEMKAALEDLGK